jgi:hypothetical protein
VHATKPCPYLVDQVGQVSTSKTHGHASNLIHTDINCQRQAAALEVHAKDLQSRMIRNETEQQGSRGRAATVRGCVTMCYTYVLQYVLHVCVTSGE